MKNIKLKQINDAIKKNKSNLITMIIFFVVGLISFSFYFYMNNFFNQDVFSFHEIIANGRSDTNLNVKVEVSKVPYAFAEYSSEITSDKYYFLTDDAYMYIGFFSF